MSKESIRHFYNDNCGKRVLLKSGHAWAGHTGIVSGVFTTCVGNNMVEIMLDYPTGQRAGVSDVGYIQIIEESK